MSGFFLARLYESTGSYYCHFDISIGIGVGVTFFYVVPQSFLCDVQSYPVNEQVLFFM